MNKGKRFFSKLKNYNKLLEEVLEKKYFSGNAKNILLSMAYKIENSYDDYKTVKRNVKTKDEFLVETIYNVQNYCEHIKLVEPNSEKAELLKKYNVLALTNEKEKSILSFPTEMALLYAISDISPKYFYIDEDYTLRKQFQYMLVDGYNQNNIEILKNFNGWSWFNEYDETLNFVNNLIYQNLLMLLGEKFLNNWKENYTQNVDNIYELKNKLSILYGKINMQRFYISMCRVLILNSRNRNKIIRKFDRVKYELERISNKKTFLDSVSEEKIEVTKRIKNIEIIMKKEILLKKELKKRNDKLDSDKRIHSVKQLVQILEREKNEYQKIINHLTEIVKPKNYLIYKEQLDQQYDIIKDLEEADLEEEIVKLQKAFLSCMTQKLQNVHTRDDIIDMIYEIRYYRKIYMYHEKMVKDYKNIENRIEKLLKEIITISCKFGIINIFCMDINYNYELVSLFLDTDIIELEEIKLLLKLNYSKNKLKVIVYDKDIVEKEVELKFDLSEKDLKVKLNRPVRIFL